MTAEQIYFLRKNIEQIGHVIVTKDGTLMIEAVMNGSMPYGEAAMLLSTSWNELDALMAEVSTLAEDHARMTKTLHDVNEKVVYAMQGTSRSQIAVDWWQAATDNYYKELEAKG